MSKASSRSRSRNLSNGGDLALADLAETVRSAFLDWFDPTGQLRVYQVDPPFEVDGGDLRRRVVADGSSDELRFSPALTIHVN